MERSIWGRQSVRSILAIAMTAALGVVGTQSAANAGGAVSAPIAQGLAGPLQFAVANNGDVYIGQAFSGALSRIDRHGVQIDAYVGAEGVDVKGEGSVSFTSTMRDANDTAIGASLIV